MPDKRPPCGTMAAAFCQVQPRPAEIREGRPAAIELSAVIPSTIPIARLNSASRRAQAAIASRIVGGRSEQPATERRDALPLQIWEGRMPRYFFNLHGGPELFDDEGVLLVNAKEIRIYMVTMATNVASDKNIRNGVWEIEALDEDGRIIATMIFDLKTRRKH